MLGGLFTLTAAVTGGVDTGWTFYAPYSTASSNSHVIMAGVGVFITGFSSILTGLNFIVTVHRMRAPGLTWFRLPLFVWSHYATSLIMILGTPVIAITVLLVAVERGLHLGIFDPATSEVNGVAFARRGTPRATRGCQGAQPGRSASACASVMSASR